MVLLLSDSTCKHLNNIDWLENNSILGANIFTIHQYIKENRARINLYTHFILHVGTNDIGNGLDLKLIEQYFSNLFTLIKDVIKCQVIISSVLPRPIDFYVSKLKLLI